MDFLGLGQPAKKRDTNSSETVYISPIALLKMIKHGRAGVPIEVMGMLLGVFADDLTVYVTDVFPMPQLGTDASVETIDEKFQSDYMELMKQTGRMENVVGWYHSHPGYGCWLSSIDMQTQQVFEKQHERCVAIVVDPIQSVKGNVVLDAFRLFPGDMFFSAPAPPLQSTGNRGHLKKSTAQQKQHGCGKSFYTLPIKWTIDHSEEELLSRLSRPQWNDGLMCQPFESLEKKNTEIVRDMKKMVSALKERVDEESHLTEDDKLNAFVGKVDPNRKLKNDTEELLSTNLVQGMNAVLNNVLFSCVSSIQYVLLSQNNQYTCTFICLGLRRRISIKRS